MRPVVCNPLTSTLSPHRRSISFLSESLSLRPPTKATTRRWLAAPAGASPGALAATDPVASLLLLLLLPPPVLLLPLLLAMLSGVTASAC